MKHTPILFSLALLGSLSISPLAAAAAETPSAQQVCTALTKSAKKAGKKPDAKAKARLALAAAIKRLEKEPENVNVGSKGKGITPIMIAAALGEKDAIRWLIAIGADPTVKDAAGKDAFARTKDKDVSALLRKASFLTWEDAISWVENMKDEDWLKTQVPDGADEETRKKYEPEGPLARERLLGSIQTLQEAETAAYVDGHELGWAEGVCLSIAQNEPYFRLYSFLLRHSKFIRDDFSITRCRHIPGERQHAFLNLLLAHRVKFSLSSCASADFANEKELHALMLKLLPSEPIIMCAVGLGDMKDWLKAAVEKGLKEAAEGKHTHHQECIHAVMATAVGEALYSMRMGWGEHEELVRYLLSQDLAGYGSPKALTLAAHLNRLDLLQLLVEAAPTTLFSPSLNAPVTLQQSLLNAMSCVRSEEVFNYLREQLKGAPATKSDTDAQILSEALAACVKTYEEQQKHCNEQKPYYDGGNPVRLKVAAFLLKQGADPGRDVGRGWTAQDYAKSDAMKQLLGETGATQQGK